MLVVDLRAKSRLRVSMDHDDIDLIRQLSTKAGCLMEDASATALIWSDGLPLATRIKELSIASPQIEALVAVAQTLLRPAT